MWLRKLQVGAVFGASCTWTGAAHPVSKKIVWWFNSAGLCVAEAGTGTESTTLETIEVPIASLAFLLRSGLLLLLQRLLCEPSRTLIRFSFKYLYVRHLYECDSLLLRLGALRAGAEQQPTAAAAAAAAAPPLAAAAANGPQALGPAL
jgi:hypothetical protein